MTTYPHAILTRLDALEQKGIIRRVRTEAGAKLYGQPIGSIIVIDKNIISRKKPSKAKTPKVIPTPRGSASKRAKQLMKDIDANTTNDGRLRAWGPEERSTAARRANVAGREYSIGHVSKKELAKARAIAIKRAKAAPKPSEWDIKDNKRIIKSGGPGGKGADGQSLNDNLRGNIYQRSANSWAIFNAFGGVDPKTGEEKDYIPCVGCGLKTTWHDDENYSNYPKFEQDKIITGRDGGQYNPQNLIPCCAGCNNQRGDANLWDSPAFYDAKPSWYTSAFTRMVEATKTPPASWRRNLAKGQGRPSKEVPDWYMPVPPGKSRESKSRLLAGIENKAIPKKEPLNAYTAGDRVQARLFNWDGSSPNAEVPENPEQLVVGVLVVDEVDSAFGTYMRYLVVLDGGAIRFVDVNSIKLLNPGFVLDGPEEKADPDGKVGASAALNRYWTRGKGLAKWATSPHPYTALVAALRAEGVPGHMVNGLAASYYHRVFKKWPGSRGSKVLESLLRLGVKDIVRTEAGARKFGLPIGSYIPGTPRGKIKPDTAPKPLPKAPAGFMKPRPKPAADVSKAPNVAEVAHGTDKRVMPVKTPSPYVPDSPPEGVTEKQMAYWESQESKRRHRYESRNVVPTNSGEYEGMMHSEMLELYREVGKKEYNRKVGKGVKRKIGEAVVAYTGTDYEDINAVLRGRDLSHLDEDDIAEVEKQVKLLDKAMDIKPAPVDMVVHRLTDSVPKLPPGTQFRDNGFVSTTISHGYLADVQEELYGHADKGSMLHMEIRVPKGTPSTYATAFQNRDDSDIAEGEMILKRGLEFRVVEIDESGPIPKMILEVVQ